MAEQKNLCYNCFQEKPDTDGPCPYCGFDLAENEKKFPVALRAGTVLNNRYIVGRVLGQGGFGITYLALDTQLNAKVAIKEFMPNDIATRIGTTVSVAMDTKSEEFAYGAERFQEEARTLAKFIGNPNIAAVTSYFDENDTSYFVMDYIEGISFKTYIANHGGKISVEETLNVMIPVLRALTAVHAEGFIHRDVTPDNIYITKDGMVKLLDFGSARYSIGDKSKSLDVILKVGYAPKEQYIRRSRQGPFTDVYSCAACFYAALTGFLPPESLERMDEDTLVPISQCGIEIPEYLDKAILKGLAVQPEDRFQSAAEFLDAIESQQVVEVPVSGGAAAPTPEKKKAKPALIAAIAAAAVVVLGIGIAIGGGGRDATDGGGGGNPVAEALAPKVTIGGEVYSTALTELDLSNLGLENADLQNLAEMKDLKSLNLSGNTEITDLSPLSGLTNLEVLQLSDGNSMVYSELSDLTPLENLTNLRVLLIPDRSNIQDLSPLSQLTALEELSIMGSHHTEGGLISNLEPLAGLSHLRVLSLNVGSTDLSPLRNLASLESVEISGDIYVDDLSVFSQLTNLKTLRLRGFREEACPTQTLEPFSGLTQLQELVIDLEGVQSFSGIEHLTALREVELFLSGGTYTNLDPFAALENLQSLSLSRSSRQDFTLDIQALSGLENLQSLNLFPSDEVLDWSPVDHVPNVTKG